MAANQVQHQYCRAVQGLGLWSGLFLRRLMMPEIDLAGMLSGASSLAALANRLG
ncbi:MAG: hypothetical protein PVF80_08760 [Gammaproteobacteria bacterium]